LLVKEERFSEDELVNLLKKQDERSIEFLYDNYSNALFGAIIQIVQEKETAEDLLQEVFVKIWKGMASYERSKGRLYTWMLNIARNASIDKLRSKGFKTNAKNRPLDNSVSYINKNFRSENNIDTIGLQKLVEQLKPEHQLMIDMLYFKGYTQSELSEELNIPLGTVKTRVRAAIIELRKKMGA